MKKLSFLLLLFGATASAQQLAPLTVQKIMRDPKWMGTSPEGYRWSADSKTIYFNWNPEGKDKAGLYKVSVTDQKVNKAETDEPENSAPINYAYNINKTMGLLEKSGDIYLTNFKSKKEIRLTNTLERESNAKFLYNNDVVYQRADNVYQLNLSTGELKQLTNFVKGKPDAGNAARPTGGRMQSNTSVQDTWLRNDQTALFDIIKKRNAEGGNRMGGTRRFGMQAGGSGPARTIKPIYLDEDFMAGLTVSPDGKYKFNANLLIIINIIIAV